MKALVNIEKHIDADNLNQLVRMTDLSKSTREKVSIVSSNTSIAFSANTTLLVDTTSNAVIIDVINITQHELSNGAILTIRDIGGNSSVNNITVQCGQDNLIDGISTTFVIDDDNKGIRLVYYNGTFWQI